MEIAVSSGRLNILGHEVRASVPARLLVLVELIIFLLRGAVRDPLR